MFEKLPYTNFHDLNLDWVISVVKDFQNKYDHIQELIDSGIVALNEKTQQSLAELNSLSENLLANLNQWYNQHQNYLDTTLANNIAAFNTAANEKIQQALESIPEDYSELSASVVDLRNLFDYMVNNHIEPYTVIPDMYIDPSTRFLKTGAGVDRTICITAEPNTTYIFKKTTPTVVRIGVADTDTPVHNLTYVNRYQTNESASEAEFTITTDMTNRYIYIQMFIDSDNPAYKNIPANINSSILILEDPMKNILRNDLGLIGNIQPEIIPGHFINHDGNINEVDTFGMTAPIPIKQGQTIILNGAGYLDRVAMICTCNSDNTERTVKVTCPDSEMRKYTYTALEDGYVVCSFNTQDYTHEISITVYYLEQFQKLLTAQEELGLVGNIDPEIIPGKFIVASDGRIDESTSFGITAPIPIKRGQTIILTGAGYSTTTAMICTCNSDNTARAVKVTSIDSTQHNYKYTAIDDGYVVCSFNTEHFAHNIAITVEYLRQFQELMNSVPDIKYEQYFNRLICIGDSLTNGATGGSASVNLQTNYPYYLNKRIDSAIVRVQAQGGASATDIWNNLVHNYNYSDFDIAVIYLGTNHGLTDTVSTDCHTDYSENADTNTGNYGKIIGRIKETSPHCKIYLVAGPNEYIRRENTMNPAVRSLAAFYSVNLIDLENSILSDNGNIQSPNRWLYRPVDAIHYNRLGYFTFGNLIAIAINQLARADLSKLNN